MRGRGTEAGARNGAGKADGEREKSLKKSRRRPVDKPHTSRREAAHKPATSRAGPLPGLPRPNDGSARRINDVITETYRPARLRRTAKSGDRLDALTKFFDA